MAIADIRGHEWIRKAIHLSSSSIPLFYWFGFERDLMLKSVIVVSSGFLLAEYLRFHSNFVKRHFVNIFGSALRHHEYTKLTGATFVFTGSVVTIFLFTKEVAVPALLILSFSDTVAALVGIPFGKHSFLAKSVEGSTAFFLASILILWVFFPGRIAVNVGIAAILTVAEAYPSNIDDNFMIPLVAGAFLTAASLL